RVSQVCRLEEGMPPVEQRIGQLEVLVRWFQGQGWPQYTQDPEGDPDAAAPGALSGTLTSLLAQGVDVVAPPAQAATSIDYLQSRLESWCDDGNFGELAEELIQGI